jgi:hypothetical protein
MFATHIGQADPRGRISLYDYQVQVDHDWKLCPYLPPAEHLAVITCMTFYRMVGLHTCPAVLMLFASV